MIFASSKTIACYLPFQSEFNSEPLIEVIWQKNKICYLPILTEKKSLYFVRYDQGDPLILNRYAIREPQNTAKIIPAEKLDLVMMPLLAFDLAGHRLGIGGGYYDKTFSFLHDHPTKKPLLIGLAYAAQQAEQLPADPWDIHLNGVVTEEGFVRF